MTNPLLLPAFCMTEHFRLPIFERFKQQDQFTDTTGPRHWVQAYYEIYNAAYNNTNWLSPDALACRHHHSQHN